VNKLNDLLRKLKQKKGYTSVESVFAIVAIMMLLLVIIGLFCYTYPRQALEKQVHLLAQQAKVTGGLTYGQVSDFKETISDMGYNANVSAYVKGVDRVVLNVAPRNTSYSACMNTAVYNPYVKRDSGQKIVITVSINANDGLLKGPLEFFGASMFPENYTLTETVMSERNRC